MKRLRYVMLCLLFATALHSQLLTWIPAFPNDNVISLDAGKGNHCLLGQVHSCICSNWFDKMRQS